MPGTARVARLVRNSVGVGAEEGTASPSDGSGATLHIYERIQWLPQFRQEEPLFAKRKPRDTEAPSGGAIRASLDSSTSIPCFPLRKKTSRETSEEAPVLPYLACLT
jgi:hypothetical protein